MNLYGKPFAWIAFGDFMNNKKHSEETKRKIEESVSRTKKLIGIGNNTTS